MKRLLLLAAVVLISCSLYLPARAQTEVGETPGAESRPPIAGPAASSSHADEEVKRRDAAGRFALTLDEIRSREPADDTVEPADVPEPPEVKRGFDWGRATRQTLLFLSVQHGYAMTQPKTRDALRGPFFRDYFRSVRSLHGWDDGGRFFTNYIAHPMQGAMLGYIQIQNDPQGRGLTVGRKKEYWKSRAKALAWSAAWSTQFEIGPVSQASIGNVGLSGKQTYVDVVITPTVGLAWLVAEDIMDQYVSRPLEERFGGRYVRIFARMLLNPVRTMTNLLRIEKPWYRDRGLR